MNKILQNERFVCRTPNSKSQGSFGDKKKITVPQGHFKKKLTFFTIFIYPPKQSQMSNSHSDANISKLCLVCKDMFGNPTFKDMCSKCFKQSKMKGESDLLKQIVFAKQQPKVEHEEWKQEKKLEQIILKEEPRDEKDSLFQDLQYKPQKIAQQEKPKKETNKCNICKKKVGILGYECKNCASTFCKFHRLPEEHSCDIDFIEIGRKKLQSQNPLVAVPKIEKF